MFGQDSTKLLTNSFQFENGIYQTFEDLKANKPTYDWDEVKTFAHINREKKVIQFDIIEVIDSVNKLFIELNQDNFWGICVEGIPYIRVIDTMKKQVQFVELRTRGKLCYYYYESFEIREVPMIIYDPETQQPIWRQSVKNKMSVTVEKILEFSNGKSTVFNIKNVKNLIVNDNKLLNTLTDLTPAEAEKKLFKMVLIYNDRNKIYID
jgi:hypothetical protein